VLAVLAILLSLPGHASAQQAGGQAPAGGTVPKQAAPKAAANGQDGGDATNPPAVKVAGTLGPMAHGEGKAKPAGAKPSHVTTAPWLNSRR
jgi:hypothetical protein